MQRQHCVLTLLTGIEPYLNSKGPCAFVYSNMEKLRFGIAPMMSRRDLNRKICLDTLTWPNQTTKSASPLNFIVDGCQVLELQGFVLQLPTATTATKARSFNKPKSIALRYSYMVDGTASVLALDRIHT